MSPSFQPALDSPVATPPPPWSHEFKAGAEAGAARSSVAASLAAACSRRDGAAPENTSRPRLSQRFYCGENVITAERAQSAVEPGLIGASRVGSDLLPGIQPPLAWMQLAGAGCGGGPLPSSSNACSQRRRAFVQILNIYGRYQRKRL